MQKWTFFAMGVMAGIIAILGGALLSQGQGNNAYAQAGRGAGDAGLGVLAIPGMSTQNQEDCLWIIHKGQPVIQMKETGINVPRATGEKMTLALYKVMKNGEQIKLSSVRDISYDLALTEYEVEK